MMMLTKGVFFFGGIFMVYGQVVLNYLFPGFAASLLFFGISEIYLCVKKEQVTWVRRGLFLLLGVYLTAVFAVTVSPDYTFSIEQFGQNINLVPFRAWSPEGGSSSNFWGNIGMFIPFGTLLVLLSKKCRRLFTALSAGVELSLFIELLQLFTVRTTDIDDVILNTVGTLCGFLLGKLLLFFIPSLSKMTAILKTTDGKLYRKHANGKSIVVLAILIYASIFCAGFSGTNQEITMPGEPGTNAEVQMNEDVEMISADIIAENAFLWNASRNAVLFEKESSRQIAPASTAKMLTALTVLDCCEEEESVMVGEEVGLIATDASRAWLNPGDELTVRQLLDALLLPSGNDAAYALAVFAGRKMSGNDEASIESALAVFIDAMNEKAIKIGASAGNFKSPDGYDTEGQYTTAHDLACIAKEFCESDVLREIAGSSRLTDTWPCGREVTYDNTNELINPDSQYYYDCAIGLKTGKSEAAGSCLVSAAYINDELYICVIMGSTEEGRWTDSLALYRTLSTI